MTNWVDSHLDQNPNVASLPIAARSRFSLHLRLSGRRRLALISAAPMHYYASASREWLPIDTRLQPLPDGRFGAPGLPFFLGLDGTVAIKGHSYRHRTWRLGFIAAPFPSLRGATAERERRSNPQDGFVELHRLPNARVHGDRLIRETSRLKLETILLPSGLREELTLFEPPQLVEGDGFFAIETLLSAGHTKPSSFNLPPSNAQDDRGHRIPMHCWLSADGRRLYCGAPVDWLAAASYPVILDPDIDITGSTADGCIEGSSPSTSTIFDASGSAIPVGGRNDSGTPKLWRGYVKFNTSSLGGQAIVEKANLRMFPEALESDVAWTIYVRQYDWSANDPMAAATREAAWDGLLAASNSGVLATSADPAGTPVTSQDLPTAWVQTEGNTYYGLWCNQEGYGFPPNQGGRHLYSSADHTTPVQRPLLMIEYVGSYPASGPVLLRSSLPAPRILLPDTRVILRSRQRRIALTAKIKEGQ